MSIESGRPRELEMQDIEPNSQANIVLQEEALRYLKDTDWLYENGFSPAALSPEGYLIKKDGTVTDLLPSQYIVNGEPYDKVMMAVRNRLEGK